LNSLASIPVLDIFKPIHERLNSLASSFSQLDLQKSRQKYINSVLSPYGSTVDRFNEPHFSLLSNSLLFNDGFRKLEIGLLSNSLSKISAFEKAHTSLVAEALISTSYYTNLAQTNLGAFQWGNIGHRSGLTDSSIKEAQKKFMDISSGYSELLRSINTKPNWIYDAPAIAKTPAQDYYVASRILKIVSTDEQENENSLSFEEEVREENKDAIGNYLPMIDRNLPDLWKGALQAMGSDNPDKIRHMITSLRELYTHILHILAPDEAILKWDEKQMNFYNGRPTRRGRFLFICRNLNGSNSQFAKFLKSEIDTTLLMIDLFQGGTHSIKPIFSMPELEFIKIKAETTLRTFLMIEFEINRK
jgi:hypothetical protein